MNDRSTDQIIVAGILAGSKEEDNALKLLYAQHWKPILAFVHSNQGNEMDARDVFQEGVIAFHRNVISGKFRQESAVGTYLFSICRFIWLKKLGSKSLTISGEDQEEIASYDDPEHRFLSREKSQQIGELFEQIGEPCRSILIMSYYENKSMMEIAALTGFKDEQNARNKKYKCMKALKELIVSNPEIRNLLKK